jgi:hypothetical protein
VIVLFVDIGRIDDYHCLNFLFIIVDLVMGRAVYQLFHQYFNLIITIKLIKGVRG